MTRRVAAAMMAASAAVALSGCTATTPTPRPTATDPLGGLEHPAVPAVHLHGRGDSTVEVPAQPEGITSVTYYVTCSPDAHFTVRQGSFFAGDCSDTAMNSGTIPLPHARRATTVRITIPDDVEFWLVGIPAEDGEQS